MVAYAAPVSYPLLDRISHPADLRELDDSQLSPLAAEIREVLVERVCATGGHLGPNLGVVELTIALHRVFDSPQDALLFDTGHQAYVHKLLTGRRDLSTLRQRHGLSGYPSRHESAHDVIENSHASTALSYADGLAKAFHLRGESGRRVVPIVGDGALTGGMAWEALNNLSRNPHGRVVIVLNDNGRSYSPTVGGLAEHLGRLRAGAGEPWTIFEALGFDYLGPVDGHDVPALEAALRRADARGRPTVVHCVTSKGRGYRPAERDLADHMHGIGQLDPLTGRPRTVGARTWTHVFAETMAEIAAARPDVVATTAAMLRPVGLHPMAQAQPGRVFDVGIAEQHALTSAAGLALGGLHPVVALYATFLNRAVDQLLMDAALHRCGVTVVLDRAGVTGEDGASHHGMWDLSLLAPIPGLRVAAPRDADQLRAALWEAVGVADAPTVVRYPKATVGDPVPAVGRVGGVDVLVRGERPDVLLVAVGALASAGVAAARTRPGVTVVDPRWPVPVPPELVRLAAAHRHVVAVEDSGRTGGVGSLLGQALHDAGVATPLHVLGVPRNFLPHGSRGAILAELGLDAAGIARTIRAL
jgi:1-deoxy-D-xylulose-5-phosphate synthase